MERSRVSSVLLPVILFVFIVLLCNIPTEAQHHQLLAAMVTRTIRPAPELKPKALGILLDASGSISNKTWQLIVDSTTCFIDKFPPNVIFFVKSFSQSVTTICSMSSGDFAKQKCIASLKGYFQDQLGTYIGKALGSAASEFHNSPLDMNKYEKEVWLLTDGESQDDTIPHAKHLMQNGLELYALGFGGANFTALTSITGREDRVITTQTFEQIAKAMDRGISNPEFDFLTITAEMRNLPYDFTSDLEFILKIDNTQRNTSIPDGSRLVMKQFIPTSGNHRQQYSPISHNLPEIPAGQQKEISLVMKGSPNGVLSDIPQHIDVTITVPSGEMAVTKIYLRSQFYIKETLKKIQKLYFNFPFMAKEMINMMPMAFVGQGKTTSINTILLSLSTWEEYKKVGYIGAANRAGQLSGLNSSHATVKLLHYSIDNLDNDIYCKNVPIKFIDIIGIDESHEITTDDMLDLMLSGVLPTDTDLMKLSQDKSQQSEWKKKLQNIKSPLVLLVKKVHAIWFVLSKDYGQDVPEGIEEKQMFPLLPTLRALRENIMKRGHINPQLLITFLDELLPQNQIIARRVITERLGTGDYNEFFGRSEMIGRDIERELKALALLNKLLDSASSFFRNAVEGLPDRYKKELESYKNLRKLLLPSMDQFGCDESSESKDMCDTGLNDKRDKKAACSARSCCWDEETGECYQQNKRCGLDPSSFGEPSESVLKRVKRKQREFEAALERYLKSLTNEAEEEDLAWTTTKQNLLEYSKKIKEWLKHRREFEDLLEMSVAPERLTQSYHEMLRSSYPLSSDDPVLKRVKEKLPSASLYPWKIYQNEIMKVIIAIVLVIFTTLLLKIFNSSRHSQRDTNRTVDPPATPLAPTTSSATTTTTSPPTTSSPPTATPSPPTSSSAIPPPDTPSPPSTAAAPPPDPPGYEEAQTESPQSKKK